MTRKGDQMTRLERHPLIPAEVEVEIPADREAADRMRHQIERRLNDWIEQFGGWPEKEPVRMKIESERGRFHNAPYRELSVTYVGERGEVIPAYLLIPTEGKPPYPAVVANHQCANDCDIGKDAVVGKAHHRPDQAYGFELVQRGYVVLAADSINCGERNVEGLRKQGENNRLKQVCFGKLVPFLNGKSHMLKRIWDASRAVDLLQSLDCVNPDRIGMIGHSLGAGTTFWAMAHDERIRAGVTSCHYLGGLGMKGYGQLYQEEGRGVFYHELLSLIAPRALFATRGRQEKPFKVDWDYDTAEDVTSLFEWCYNYGSHILDLYGVSTVRMHLRPFDGGHQFPPDVRADAYVWLDRQLEHDGRLENGRAISPTDDVMSAP